MKHVNEFPGHIDYCPYCASTQMDTECNEGIMCYECGKVFNITVPHNYIKALGNCSCCGNTAFECSYDSELTCVTCGATGDEITGKVKKYD